MRKRRSSAARCHGTNAVQTNITSGYFSFSLAMSSSGFITPVEVSVCTRVTVSNSPEAGGINVSGRVGIPNQPATLRLPDRSAGYIQPFIGKAPHMQHNSFR